MESTVFDWLRYFNHGTLPTRGFYAYVNTLILFACLVAIVFIMWLISRKILVSIFHAIALKTTNSWDDHLIENKFFAALANLVPLFCMNFFLDIVFYAFLPAKIFFTRAVDVLILFVIMVAINRMLKSVKDWLQEKDAFKDKPLQSFYQVLKIIVVSFFLILMISMLTNRSPLFFLTSLGAMTAILLLIFKDTILGFVGSIQLAANDMIRIGDWITMDKYGADGDVIEINLTTVKVKNFDLTYTTIPTYSFITDSFKNWRGMQESKGRRIKRAMKMKIDTVQFASPALLEKLSKIKILKDFIADRQAEIEKDNKEKAIHDSPLNGRNQTNLGLFRRYIEYYLKHNPKINQKTMILVRQLEATEFGVPVEVYCFSKTINWSEYEAIQGDVFDHLFAASKFFELEIFERPSGSDFKKG